MLTKKPPQRTCKRCEPVNRKDVLQLVVDGKTDAEIAAIYGTSERCIRREVDRWKDELQAYKRTYLVTKAFREGMVA